MIDFNVCLTGYALGVIVGAVAALFNLIISALFGLMKG